MANLVDVLSAEDRVQVKFSDYHALVKAAEDAKILKNAVMAEIPYEQIRKLLSGKNDELEEYRKTELTPDQIREIDRLYTKLCEESIALKKEKDALQKQLDDLRNTILTATQRREKE